MSSIHLQDGFLLVVSFSIVELANISFRCCSRIFVDCFHKQKTCSGMSLLVYVLLNVLTCHYLLLCFWTVLYFLVSTLFFSVRLTTFSVFYFYFLFHL